MSLDTERRELCEFCGRNPCAPNSCCGLRRAAALVKAMPRMSTPVQQPCEEPTASPSSPTSTNESLS